MKKAVLLCILLFLVGLAAGFFSRGWVDQTQMRSFSKGIPCGKPATAVPEESNGVMASDSAEKERKVSNHTTVLMTALKAVEEIKAKDYKRLSTLIHPETGVLFAPYSTVDPEVNLTFSSQEIANLESDNKQYVWGILDGKNNVPIELTLKEYFDTFVFNADYTATPVIGVNQIMQTGNSLENVMEVYPDAQFVEFHYPAIQPSMEGMDWCSLKIVFKLYKGTYKIVALIHSQWTV